MIDKCDTEITQLIILFYLMNYMIIIEIKQNCSGIIALFIISVCVRLDNFLRSLNLRSNNKNWLKICQDKSFLSNLKEMKKIYQKV